MLRTFATNADGEPIPAELERKVGDYAVIGVGVQVALDEAGNVAQAGIGLCNAGSISIKATRGRGVPGRQAAGPGQRQRGRPTGDGGVRPGRGRPRPGRLQARHGARADAAGAAAAPSTAPREALA